MNLALFDFDGTLTNRDSFIEIIKFAKGKKKFFLGFIILSPVLIFLKLKLIKNWRAKEIVFGYFFKGTSENEFSSMCSDFTLQEIPKMLRPGAIDKVKEYQNSGTKVYIVSASAEDWLVPWFSSLNIEVLGTKLQKEGGKITGKIDGKNCYGAEKVNRVKKELSLNDFKEIHVYGDSSGDKEMFELGTEKFFKPFR